MNRGQVVSVSRRTAFRGAGPLVQRLKAERVQEPLALLRTELKAERVQEELADAGGAGAQFALALELAIQQPQAVTVELAESKVTITFHGDSGVNDAG